MELLLILSIILLLKKKNSLSRSEISFFTMIYLFILGTSIQNTNLIVISFARKKEIILKKKEAGRAASITRLGEWGSFKKAEIAHFPSPLEIFWGNIYLGIIRRREKTTTTTKK